MARYNNGGTLYRKGRSAYDKAKTNIRLIMGWAQKNEIVWNTQIKKRKYHLWQKIPEESFRNSSKSVLQAVWGNPGTLPGDQEHCGIQVRAAGRQIADVWLRWRLPR